MSDRTCNQCGQAIPDSRQRNAMYCSNRCTNRAAHLRRGQSGLKCERAGCDSFVWTRGLCRQHYKALRRSQGKHRIETFCAQCGVQVSKVHDPRRSNRFCSWACRTEFMDALRPPKGVVVPLAHSGYSRVPSRHPAHPLRSAVAHIPAAWVSGPCVWCGHVFTARIFGNAGRYCSDRCSARAQDGRRRSRYGEFTISDVDRYFVYERDKWICQLCFEPVDSSLPYTDGWSATLDHIICQSWTLIPDHSVENLRLAHRICNSVRGNRANFDLTGVVNAESAKKVRTF